MTQQKALGNQPINVLKGQNPLVLILIGAVALTIAIIAIIISSRSPGAVAAKVDYADIPQSRAEDGGFVLGNPSAPITIVAFEDFLCPHCQAYKPTVNELIEKYVVTGLAKFEYRMLPAVDPTFSVLAAKFAECADTLRPGSFWSAHDALFEIASSQRFNSQAARVFAERMELSYSDLLDCADTATQVQTDMTLANRLGVTGTPTVMVRYGNGEPQRIGSQAPDINTLGALITNQQ